MTPSLDTLPRDQLLAVAHEYMLLGMLSNQATLPQTIVAGGTLDDLNEVAIDLWMGASPVYTHRMRTLMGIEGDDVPTIMKALQLDVGFVHQYMDVFYKVNDPLHGEFWLAHCGALINVEPHGEERVHGMCHTIEDPTFDATAYATNPRARIRPIHRPPRAPADRLPHCHWTIEIDPANDPVGPARLTQQISELPLASLAITPRPAGDGYPAEFDPKFRLSDASDGTLIALAIEFAVQTHLLMCSGEIALAERFGADTARELIADAWLATSWVASERLRELLGDGVDVATVLALTPAIPPGFAREVAVDGSRVRLTLIPESPELLTSSQTGWIGALGRGERRGIEGIVWPIDRTARVDSGRGGRGTCDHRRRVWRGRRTGEGTERRGLHAHRHAAHVAVRSRVKWEGDEYQRRFDELAASGVDVHGEADFVMRFAPQSVLDAGCGTGRVGIELARRGIEVVGVDVDASMLATARKTAPDDRMDQARPDDARPRAHVRRRVARGQRAAVHPTRHAPRARHRLRAARRRRTA